MAVVFIRKRHDEPTGDQVITTFVIGLREGLEASLIVGIIAAFVILRKQRHALLPMWLGVAAAVLLSVTMAVALNIAGQAMSTTARETMEGLLALVAVGGITYMIVWMRRHGPGLRLDLEQRTGEALAAGSAVAVVGMAFVAVLREGLETAVFLLATFQTTRSPAAAAFGAIAGIVAAVVIGYGVYRGGIHLDLRRFFRITGAILVVVAAGLLAAGVHSLAEAGVVTILQQSVVDLSWLIAPGTIRSSLLTAFLGLQPVPTAAELLVWCAYAIPMLVFVLRPSVPVPRPPITTTVNGDVAA
jgi:high-affinity iron transporter